nr:AI-2E family transporter [Blastocatellia bacterium]
MHNVPETEKTFAQQMLTAIMMVTAALLLILLVYHTIDVLLLVFSAALLAVFLRGLAIPAARYLNIREVFAVLLVSLLLLTVLAGAIAMLAPNVAAQGRVLQEQLPQSAQLAANYISQFEWGRTLIAQLPSVETIKQRVDIPTLLSGVGGVFSSTVGIVGNLLIGILIAVYIATEPRLYVNGFIRLFSESKRPRVNEVMD